MSKKKLTNREITEAILELGKNDQNLWQYLQILKQEVLEIKQVFEVYLKHKGDTEVFNKFINKLREEFEQKQSNNKGGA